MEPVKKVAAASESRKREHERPASSVCVATVDTASEYNGVVVAAVAVILHHCDWNKKETYVYIHTDTHNIHTCMHSKSL